MDNLGQRVAATTAVMDMTQSQILSHSLARVGQWLSSGCDLPLLVDDYINLYYPI